MTRTPSSIATLLLSLALIGSVPTALAQALAPAPTAAPSYRTASNTLSAISAAKAGQIARQLYGGRVIDVKQVHRQGLSVFRVKLLQNNGRIHSVLIDANSGRPLQ
jgi:hypothetical protein